MLPALIVSLVCGFVSATTGRKKGYSYGAFFALGFFLGIIGLIVSLVIQNKNAEKNTAADTLLKYKMLLNEGVISQEEFDMKKEELLSSSSLAQPSSSGVKSEMVIAIIGIAFGAIVFLLYWTALQTIFDPIWIVHNVPFILFDASSILAIVASSFIIASSRKRDKKLSNIALFVSIASLVCVLAGIIIAVFTGLLYLIFLILPAASALTAAIILRSKLKGEENES